MRRSCKPHERCHCQCAAIDLNHDEPSRAHRPLFAARRFAIWFSALTASIFAIVSAAATSSAPDHAAQRVGPGTISSTANEFASSLSPDGAQIVFNRTGPDGTIHIFMSVKSGASQSTQTQSTERWGEAVAMPFSDARYRDLDPFISRAGDRLYFSSNRPIPESQSASQPPGASGLNTWYAPWTGETWGAPVYAGDTLNAALDDVFISESADGTLVFARFLGGDARPEPVQLMMSTRMDKGNGFNAPTPFPAETNAVRLTNPAISADGMRVIAAGRGHNGVVGLFISEKTHGAWSPFRSISACKAPRGGAFAPYQSNDGQTLYFTRNPGKDEANASRDIWKIGSVCVDISISSK